MDVLKFWRTGSQIVSLNWQTYDTGMHINEGMFVGTSGWVLKPEKLLKNTGTEISGIVRLVADIVGISSCKLVGLFILGRAAQELFFFGF